ncbi:hypothetical protein PMALA_011470, partial [Plasmodium malariae]
MCRNICRDVSLYVKWGKIVSSVSNALDFNQATLSGCIDIICIESEIENKLKGDNKLNVTYKSTPFHVRFGKTKLLRSKEKIVSILVNGKSTNLHMKLGSAGEAYFVEKTYEDVEEELETSPLSSPRYEYHDLYIDQHIDSCSISDSLNNFKSDEDDSDKFSVHNLTGERRKSVDLNYKLEKNKGKKKSNTEINSKSDNNLVNKDGKEQEKKKKKSLVHRPSELMEDGIVHKRKTKEDEQNANSEWSWSWGRLPHLKTHDYVSDNCTVISSNNKNKKKTKVKKYYNVSESVHDHSSSKENEECVRKRNFSESN